MNTMYEVGESTSTNLPSSLLNVLKTWTKHEDEDDVYLLMSALYVLTLESGFTPHPNQDTEAAVMIAPWLQSEAKLKISHYDRNRVNYYTTHFSPFKICFDGPFFWQFVISNFPHITIICELIPSACEKMLRLVVVIDSSDVNLGQCYKVAHFVPNPKYKNPAEKYANLKELSKDFKTMMSIARSELLYKEGYTDKTAFEFLPDIVHANIAKYLPRQLEC